MLFRSSACARSIRELLFVLMMLGDDRTVAASYVQGRLASLASELPGEVTSGAARAGTSA